MVNPADSPQAALRLLLERAGQTTLHRLAGNRNLVDGWALLGAPPAKQAVVEERCLEDRVLLDRLRWLLEAALAGEERPVGASRSERARVLLLGALRLGAPEDPSSEALPELPAELAEAAAAWVVCAGGAEPRWQVRDGCLRLLASERGLAAPAWWVEQYGALEGLQAREGGLEVALANATAAEPR